MVFTTVLRQLEDTNGRGEFDDETDLIHAVQTVVDWIKYNEANERDLD